MWRELIHKLNAECTFFAPASHEQLAELENALKIPIPDELKSLLLETNGFYEDTGVWLIWPVNRIEDVNLDFRDDPDFKKLYMPFHTLLFFEDLGNGDQLAFPILDGLIRSSDIYTWNHENDDREWAAFSIQDYLKRFLKAPFKS